MIQFKMKPNGIHQSVAVLLLVAICLIQVSFGHVNSRNREVSKQRSTNMFRRETVDVNPYVRDVRADSRRSRIDARDIRTDFREIRSELRTLNDINNNRVQQEDTIRYSRLDSRRLTERSHSGGMVRVERTRRQLAAEERNSAIRERRNVMMDREKSTIRENRSENRESVLEKSRDRIADRIRSNIDAREDSTGRNIRKMTLDRNVGRERKPTREYRRERSEIRQESRDRSLERRMIRSKNVQSKSIKTPLLDSRQISDKQVANVSFVDKLEGYPNIVLNSIQVLLTAMILGQIFMGTSKSHKFRFSNWPTFAKIKTD